MSAPEPIWISFEGKEPPPRRTIDEAIFVRFPAALRTLAWFTFRLPRSSRLRQASIRRTVLQAQGAWMRGDFEPALLRYAPDALLTAESDDRMRLDFEPSYQGREGVRTFMRTYQDAFARSSYEPKWVVDLGGNVLVMLLHHSVHGRASGAQVEQVSAHRLQLRDGLVVREEIHVAPGHDWESVVRAVSLDTDGLAGRSIA